jgi:O-antigen/teichoic acid export membrane protein
MSGKVVTLMRAHAARGWLHRLHGVEKALILGATGSALLNVAQIFLNFFVTLSLAHLLGASGVGIYAYAFAWASVLAVPSVLGLTPLVVRHVAAYRVQGEWGLLRGLLARANHAVVLSSALLVTGGAIACLLVNGARREFLYPVLVSLLLIPIVALTSIRQAAMQGLGRVVLGRTPETLVAPALFLVLVSSTWVLPVDLSATWAVALQVAAAFVALVIGVVLLRRVLPPRVTAERSEYDMKAWIRSAIPLLLFSVVQALNVQIEVILLGALDSAASAGLFSVAGRIAGLVTFVMIAVGYPLSPMIARLHAEGQTALLERTVRRAATGVFLASVPIALGVIVLARPLLGVVGAEFAGAETALILIVAAQLVFAATGFAGTVLVMTGHESWLVRGVAAGAVLNAGLNALLIPPFGLNGAAVASTIASTTMSVCLAYFARRRAGVPATAFGF